MFGPNHDGELSFATICRVVTTIISNWKQLNMWINAKKSKFHWVYSKLHIKCDKFQYKINGWKVCSKLANFQ